MSPKQALIAMTLIAAPSLFALTVPALAGSGGNLPWEGPLEQIQESITGLVAGYIALAAVAIAGGMLIFGGELNDNASALVTASAIIRSSASTARTGDDTDILGGEGKNCVVLRMTAMFWLFS